MTSDKPSAHTELENQSWEVKEQPFSSKIPVFGPLIIRFRETWNSVSTKWYVRNLLVQQNKINAQISEQLAHLQSQLIEQDREQSEFVHDMAELTTHLIQMNQLLESIETRLIRLEGNKPPD